MPNFLGKFFSRGKSKIPYSPVWSGFIPDSYTSQDYLKSYEEVGWWHAVVFRIALGVSEVKWTLWNVRSRNKPKQIFDHPILKFLHLINPFQTFEEFIALDTIYMESIGESFWILNFNKLGEPKEAVLPYPQKMSVIPARAFPFVKGYVYGNGAEAIPFDVNEIIHFKYPNPRNQYRGLGQAQAVGINLNAERNADLWVNQFFLNSARPDGVLEFDYNLSDEQFDRLKKQWAEKYRGVSKAHQVAVIEKGKYVQIQNTVKDMDFPNLKLKNRDIILGVEGMPQSVMGISENVNKANAEAGDYTFARWIVKPRLNWKCAKLQEQLIPKFRGSENLKLGFEEVVPETLDQKKELAESGMRAGYLTIDEARKLQGLDPLPNGNGNVLLIPMNLLPTPIKGEMKPPPPKPTEPPSENTEEELEEESKGGSGSGNFGHGGRPGEVGGSGSGELSIAASSFIENKVKITGKSEADKEGLKKVEGELRNADIPDSHFDVVNSVEINTAKTNKKGGLTVAYCDGSNNIVLNGKVGTESLTHEMGHAYFQREIFVPKNDDKWIVANAFNASQKTGNGFVSIRAKLDAEEYFAEGYAAFAKDSKSFTKLNPTMGKLLKKYWK